MDKKVQWVDWGEEAFGRAGREDKPILLGISAVWCHWCHVMDHTTYSDPEVADYINEHFIPIRVDNDRRPDINSRYNMGGWPTTAFLTPEGDVITGATYIPPSEMKLALARVLEHFKANRDELISSPERQERLKEVLRYPEADAGSLLREAVIDYAVLSVMKAYDPTYGGLGRAPKFPHAPALCFLLGEHKRSGDRALLAMALNTLDKMGWSGMYDQVEGGFFRYSTDREWKVPHFEKMLEDNARLLRVYLMAYQITGQHKYAEKARDTIRYLDNNFKDPDCGAFYGSQDADEEYYSQPMAKRKEMVAPYIDKTFYCDWNGAVISSYLLASVVLRDERLGRSALSALDFILEKGLDKGRGVVSHYFNGEPSEEAFLSDQATMLEALTDAFEFTQERKYLERAENLAGAAIDVFYDEEGGGFFDIPGYSNARGILKYRMKPLAENAQTAQTLTRLHYLTGSEHYRELAERTVAAFYTSYRSQSFMVAPLANATAFMVAPPAVVHIVGRKGDPETAPFLRSSLEIFETRRVVRIFDPFEEGDALLKLGYSVTKEPAAYVCFPGRCEGPFRDAQEVKKKVEKKDD